MFLFDKRFTLKYIWAFLLSALMIFVLGIFFWGFRANFQKRSIYTLTNSTPLTCYDSTVVLTILPPQEVVNIIAVDFDDRTHAMVENEEGYRGWIHIKTNETIPIIKTKAMATFTPKRFDKRIIGRTIDEIEKKHGLALDIKPYFGNSFEATFPYRIFDYSSGRVTEQVRVIFVNGTASSYRMKPVRSVRWENNKYFPLVPAIISMGISDRAPQSDIILKYFDCKPLSGFTKIATIIVLLFLSLTFLGMIPYLIEKPILDIVRFSPAASRIGGKLFVIVFNFIVYYISVQILFAWIGFSWIALAIAIMCMLSVILKKISLVSCLGYVYLMDAKCEKCNRTRSYEEVDKKVINCVPYDPVLHDDFFDLPPRRRTRQQRAESIFKTDVTPKRYKKNSKNPSGFVEEYEYTFKCKYCGETATCKTKDLVAKPTITDTPAPKAAPSPQDTPSVLEDDDIEII